MLQKYFYNFTLLLLLSCTNQFHQSLLGVKKQKAIIRYYIKAEDMRDSVALKHLLSDTIINYWQIENPTKQKIISFYKDYWTKNKFSKNNIQSIIAVDENTYTVKTFFEVQRIHADTSLRIVSTILYKLNEFNKIVSVGKE